LICFRTSNNRGVTKVLSEVKIHTTVTPNISYAEGVEVLSPVLLLNRSIIVSYVVVLSFIPDTECVLISIDFNRSQRHVQSAGSGISYSYTYICNVATIRTGEAKNQFLPISIVLQVTKVDCYLITELLVEFHKF